MAGMRFSRFLGDLRGRALWVVFGCLICQLGLGFGYVYAPLLKEISSDLGWTRAMFSSARVPVLFVIALASPLIGTLTARFGARRVLVPAALLLCPAFLIISRMQSLWELYTANLLLGLAMAGLGDIAVGSVVARWIVRGRGLALGVVYTGSNLAGLILPPLVAFLSLQVGWRVALFGLGVAGTLLLLPFAGWVVREPRSDERPPGLAPNDGDERYPTAASLEVGLPLSRALTTRSFWILVAALFSYFFYFLGTLEHLVSALTDAGMPNLEAAAHFSFAIGLGIVSKIAMGVAADRMTARSALLLNYGVLALSSLLLLRIPDAGFLQLFLVTYGFAVAGRDVVYPLVVAQCFGVRSMPQIYGAMLLVLAPAGSLGAIFPGAIHDWSGSYDLAFSTYAILNLLTVLGLFWIRDELPLAYRGRPVTPALVP